MTTVHDALTLGVRSYSAVFSLSSVTCIAETAVTVGHSQSAKQTISLTEPSQLSPSAHVAPSLPGSDGGSEGLSSPSELLAPVDVTQLTPHSMSQETAEN